MFKSALLKLTGLYLLILMIVSLLFSLNVYRISTQEVNNRLRRQVEFFTSQPVGPGMGAGGAVGFSTAGPFETERLQELSGSKRSVLVELLYANLIVLVVGGVGSYLLARETIKPIEEAHDAQVRFTADASHELRTPLAAMRAETEVALRDPKLNTKEARELLASNVEELERLSVLSDGLLQLARGKDDIDMGEQITLKNLVNSATKQTNHAAKAKHITVTTEQLQDITLTGNKTQLVQLLVILLDNAIKYSPEKQLVSIGAEVDHNQLHLAITDNGYGMAAHDLQHIFERFYRVSAARNQAHSPGYGLGLAIAQQIAEAHHGTISVTSARGKGSVFTLNLPVAKV